MKMKKMIAVFACALLAATVALAGCSRQQSSVADEAASDVAGTYMCESVSLDGEELSGYTDKVILEENGHGTCVYDDEEYELRWELDGTAIAWSDDSGDKFKGTVDFDAGTITGVYSIDFVDAEAADLDYVFEKVQ